MWQARPRHFDLNHGTMSDNCYCMTCRCLASIASDRSASCLNDVLFSLPRPRLLCWASPIRHMQHLPRQRMPPRLADARYSRDPVCNQTTNSTMTHPDISPGSCLRPAWRGTLNRLSAQVSQKARLAFVDIRSFISSDAGEASAVGGLIPRLLVTYQPSNGDRLAVSPCANDSDPARRRIRRPRARERRI